LPLVDSDSVKSVRYNIRDSQCYHIRNYWCVQNIPHWICRHVFNWSPCKISHA